MKRWLIRIVIALLTLILLAVATAFIAAHVLLESALWSGFIGVVALGDACTVY